MSAESPHPADLLHTLSFRLGRLQQRMAETHTPGPGAFRGIVDGVWMRIAPARITPFPSDNRNRAEPLPGGADWSERAARTFQSRYDDAGIKPFFFWLSPSAMSDKIESDLVAAGLKRFTRARYPVLARHAATLPPPETTFTVRRFDRKRDAARFRNYPNPEMSKRILAPKTPKGMETYLAWDGDDPVAMGSLFVHRGLGYLHTAGTLESHRGRGAQSALIAARINRAAELGCDWVMSETVSVLKTSMANLERQGFEVVFWKKVFERPTLPPAQ